MLGLNVVYTSAAFLLDVSVDELQFPASRSPLPQPDTRGPGAPLKVRKH